MEKDLKVASLNQIRQHAKEKIKLVMCSCSVNHALHNFNVAVTITLES